MEFTLFVAYVVLFLGVGLLACLPLALPKSVYTLANVLALPIVICLLLGACLLAALRRPGLVMSDSPSNLGES